ncbi:Cytochrome P450 monooxygenase PC-21 [Paramyrothecium foliicola]|nr:Cytochrome P450 monooxygenase PC-21 [Paramyrothecium foliicola]
MAKILSIQGVTVIAFVAALLIFKLFPDVLTTHPGDGEASAFLRCCAILLTLSYTSLFLWSFVVFPVFISPLRNLPQPKWFLARLIHSRFVRQEHQGQLLLDIVQSTPNDGLVLLREGIQDRVLVASTPIIAELLVHRTYDFIKPPEVADFMRHFLGDGLIIVEGERHKWLRKQSQRAFAYRHIKDLYPVMWSKALALLADMRTEVARQQQGLPDAASQVPAPPGAAGRFEISTWTENVTFDVIGLAGLGRDFDLVRNPDDQLARDYNDVTGPHMLLFFVLSMWFSFDFVQSLPWSKNKVFNNGTQSMKRICKQLVQEKKEKIAKSASDQVDILSRLVGTEAFSDDDLAEQLLTYLVAGHDTTSATLTWIFYLLAKYPSWQKKIREELAEAKLPMSSFPMEGRAIGAVEVTLESLPVLNGVINETLRLYPTVPVTTRIAVKDTSLGGHMIPKGTNLLVSPWLNNQSRKQWGPQAQEFDPARWIDARGRPNNSGGAESNYDFLTFLHGPRSCIGKDFAKAELRCILAAVAKGFEWTLDMDEKDVIAAGAITIKPQKGLFLKMTVANASEVV